MEAGHRLFAGAHKRSRPCVPTRPGQPRRPPGHAVAFLRAPLLCSRPPPFRDGHFFPSFLPPIVVRAVLGFKDARRAWGEPVAFPQPPSS